jgi:hypothetical protein
LAMPPTNGIVVASVLKDMLPNRCTALRVAFLPKEYSIH